MHNLLEIIIPNDTKDVKRAISEIMGPFDESSGDPRHGFWDFYTIGGRFAGRKLVHTLDEDRLSKFYDLLSENKITVSGITCGKQEIYPSEQIPLVDKLWNDLFPENDGRPCPLFKHSNNQYDKYGIICGDIMPVKECLDFYCCHMIIGGVDYSGNSYEAKYMLQDSIYNGVCFQKTVWNGKISSGIALFNEYIKNYNEDYKKRFDDIKNWLSITVDYHS